MRFLTPTVGEIVAKYLRANGYDGLCSEECGCLLDDFAPCDSMSEECQAGIKVTILEARLRGFEDIVGENNDWAVISEFPKEAKG